MIEALVRGVEVRRHGQVELVGGQRQADFLIAGGEKESVDADGRHEPIRTFRKRLRLELLDEVAHGVGCGDVEGREQSRGVGPEVARAAGG